jgi:hypothetical protein
MTTKAWAKAQSLAEVLPHNISWCFCITDEDRGESLGNAVFNIFTTDLQWPNLRLFLGLGEPDEQDANSQSWLFPDLTLSLIKPEEHNGLDEPDGPDTHDPD